MLTYATGLTVQNSQEEHGSTKKDRLTPSHQTSYFVRVLNGRIDVQGTVADLCKSGVLEVVSSAPVQDSLAHPAIDQDRCVPFLEQEMHFCA